MKHKGLALLIIFALSACKRHNKELLFENTVTITLPSSLDYIDSLDSFPVFLHGFYEFKSRTAYLYKGANEYLGIILIDDSCNIYDLDFSQKLITFRNIFDIVYPHILWEDEGIIENRFDNEIKYQNYSISFNNEFYFGIIGIVCFKGNLLYINYSVHCNYPNKTTKKEGYNLLRSINQS